MNLNEIRSAVKTVDREVEFKPAGESTGWYFQLRHESSAEVQDVIRAFHSKVRNLTLKRKTSAYESLIAQHEDQLRMAHVASWRWELGDDAEASRPPFHKRELKTLLNDPVIGYHLKVFIDEEVGSLEDFLSRSDNS